MPELCEIIYSRDACVAAVRDYYGFLTKMYLNESDVIEPPESGWPTITTEIFQGLGKTEEVISLLRHLPYIRRDDGYRAEGAPGCYFADWQLDGRGVILGGTDGHALRICSENACFYEDVPPHVISLTKGSRDNPVFLLDTKLGVVYWPECNGKIRYNPSREAVQDDPYDWAPEREAWWRADGAWAVADFFEILKDQFRELHYIPISSRTVREVYTYFSPNSDIIRSMVQDIYREHCWPDLERYRKRECLNAVKTALKERFPDDVDCCDE